MSTRQRVIDLAHQRIPPRDIAVRLNCAPDTVHQYISAARRAGMCIPKFTNGRPNTTAGYAHINHETAAALRPHADRRGLPLRVLAKRLLAEIARDDLVDAILDDGGCDD
jgi:hypothetical protein